MNKRLLSTLLVLCMALTLLPFGTQAADLPVTAPYRKTLRFLQTNTGGNANGLYIDVDDNGIPELLIAYEYYDGTNGVALDTIQDGNVIGLVNTSSLQWSAEGRDCISIITRNGSKQVLAEIYSFYPYMYDEYYGQLYREECELWLYRYADGKITKTDHWYFNLVELEDGRFFEDESTIKRNNKPATADDLNAFLSSFSVLCTVSRYDDTDGYPIDQLMAVAQGKFIDVAKSAYYAEPVDWAVENKVTNGTSAMTFSPENPCTRGQVVTFLWRAAGSPAPKSSKNPFNDVSKDAYYYKAVLWAVEQGITNGTSAATFSPGNPCTRGQVVTFLYRNADSPKVSAKNPFKDVKSGAYYYDAVLWAVKNEITNGTSKTAFSPNQTCTRGQIVTFLFRCLADGDWTPATPIGNLTMTSIGEGVASESYAFGLAWYVSTNSDTTVDFVTGSGSKANLDALAAGKVQLCLCSYDIASHAYNGTGPFSKTGAFRDFSVLAALYMDTVRIITLDNDLQSVPDLKGKTVAVGTKDSSAYLSALDILSVYGLSESDIKPVYKNFVDAADDLDRGKIDAIFVVTDDNYWIYDTFGVPVNYIRMDDAHIDALTAKAPYYSRRPTGDSSYSQPDSEGMVSIGILLLARNDVADEDAYQIVSTIFSSKIQSNIRRDYPKAIELNPEYASGITDLPYHPGTAAYFGK